MLIDAKQIRPSLSSAILTIPDGNGVLDFEQTIAVVGMLPTKTVKTWLAPGNDADENEREFLSGVDVFGTAQADAILFTLSSPEPISGPVLIQFEVI